MMYEKGASGLETPGLEDYLAAIRHRKWLVLICALLGLVGAVAFSQSRTNSYTASSKVLVNPTPVGSRDGRLVEPVLEREREVVAGNAVANLVIEDLALSTTPRVLLTQLEVEFVDKSDSLELSFSNPGPEMAQDIVNSWAQGYVDLRVSAADDFDANAISELERQISAIDEQVGTLQLDIDSLSEEAARREELELTSIEQEEQLRILRDAVSSLNAQRRDLNRDLTDVVIAANTRTIPAEVLQFATVPSTPTGFSNNILRIVGLILGVGAGVGLAFVLHRLDRTARESADVELALGTNVLASIPAFGLGHRAGSNAVVMMTNGRSARVQQARESFRRLRSSLQFLRTSKDAKTFLITSARPSEGKSTTAANLGVALAQGDTRVCLVNADLRRPMLEKLMGIPNQRGIAEWLNDPTITDIMVPAPAIPGLVIVPAGNPPPNPGELLATGRISQLLEELADQFDIVIVDAPPVLSAADAAAISPSVDGTLIVVDASRTDTDALLRVRDEVSRAGGVVAGAILNRDRNDSGIRLRKDRYAYERVSAARSTQ
ncbi:MAG: polysaccharide biosynthesis tyrosine autokinase [Acidimicrobiales bacterium]